MNRFLFCNTTKKTCNFSAFFPLFFAYCNKSIARKLNWSELKLNSKLQLNVVMCSLPLLYQLDLSHYFVSLSADKKCFYFTATLTRVSGVSKMVKKMMHKKKISLNSTVNEMKYSIRFYNINECCYIVDNTIQALCSKRNEKYDFCDKKDLMKENMQRKFI